MLIKTAKVSPGVNSVIKSRSCHEKQKQIWPSLPTSDLYYEGEKEEIQAPFLFQFEVLQEIEFFIQKNMNKRDMSLLPVQPSPVMHVFLLVHLIYLHFVIFLILLLLNVFAFSPKFFNIVYFHNLGINKVCIVNYTSVLLLHLSYFSSLMLWSYKNLKVVHCKNGLGLPVCEGINISLLL